MIVEDKEYCETTKDILLPKRSDGSEYKISKLCGDQRDVLDHVFMNLSKCLNLKDKNKATEKELVRMIVCGHVGSGKSTLDNIFVTTIRKTFQHTNSTAICAPTGDAANEVAGETIHKFATCSIHGKKFKTLSTDDKDRLHKLLCTTICFDC